MTRVLLISGTGLIGPWVLAGLRGLQPGVEIWAMNRRGQAFKGVTALWGDRHDPAAVRVAVKAAQPEVVMDMIAFTGPEAQTTAEALRDHGTPRRTIVVSSADVYEAFSRLNGLVGGEPETEPMTEASPLRAGAGAQGAAYDMLGVEQTYAAALGNVAALRLPAVSGWPDRSRIEDYAGTMLDVADEIAPHARVAHWRFARVLNRNAGFAVALAALGGWLGFRAWNVAEPVSPTESDWVGRIGRAAGWGGRIVEREGNEPPGFTRTSRSSCQTRGSDPIWGNTNGTTPRRASGRRSSVLLSCGQRRREVRRLLWQSATGRGCCPTTVVWEV